MSRFEPEAALKVETSDFVCGAGIECSFVPHLNIDQFEWTQHNRFWEDDFKRAREELGVTALRYSLPWHQIEPQRNRFVWDSADERVSAANDLGLDLYLDVMHFGTPLWLRQAAGDPEFPEALEAYTGELVKRYRSTITHWCPCNEPLVLALFSGDFGFWPPHSRKWKGYMPVLSRIVQATSRAIRAIRSSDPQATVLLCDNVENFKSHLPDLQSEVQRRNLRRYLGMDLLLGRVDHHHPLFGWLTGYGFSELDLEWCATHPQTPDVLGIDYYPNSEWQLEKMDSGIMQRRTESPIGLFGIARAYYRRYGLPMMLTETSADGHPINREIWLDQTIEDCRRLRECGIPMSGYFWWPMVDQLDWDGALTHRVGKIHDVGLFNLRKMPDGTLARHRTPLADKYAAFAADTQRAVGKLQPLALPANDDDQGPPVGLEIPTQYDAQSSQNHGNSGELRRNGDVQSTSRTGVSANGNKCDSVSVPLNGVDAVPALSSEPGIAGRGTSSVTSEKATDRYGIIVFSHLRWGFVWQRPQQFLSRFARKHRVLFVEEPMFDLAAGVQPRLDIHQVMPNVTVLCPHLDKSWLRRSEIAELLVKFTRDGIERLNADGEFARPLLWYYSPMDAAWSLGEFENRGIVYDCMDELSQFTGAPKALVDNEFRLMQSADVVFTGGYELGEKKQKHHHNVHAFGCGVDLSHFAKASDPDTRIPPDIDFMTRPILGWFGVIDERVDYALIGEMARLRPGWSFAMIGPVVKMDANQLPHAPNLFWLGGRDYQQLPYYCRAFDVNMMCFAINAATQFINPTKGLEYMATGKPIVSTPVRDVVRQWSDIVYIARTAEEFVAAAEVAMKSGPTDERVKRGIELATRSSWDSTVGTMQTLIRDAIGRRDRPSSRPVPRLARPQVEYLYAATQGS